MDYAKGSCARNFNQSIPKFPNPVKALKEDFRNKNRPPSDGVHYNPAFEDGDDENTDVKQSNGQANSELRSSNESGPDVTSTLVKGPTISDSQTSAKSNESGPDVTSRPCLQRQIQDNRRADEGNHGLFSSNLPSENFRLNSTFLEPNTHANRTDFDGIGAPFQLRPNYRYNGNFGTENTLREPNTHANRTDYDGIGAPFQPRPNYRYNGNFGTENTLRELNTHANRTDFDGIGAPFQHRQNYRYNGNFGTENTLRSSRWDSPEHQTFYQEDCLPPRIPTDNSPPRKTEPNTHANRTDYDGIGAPFQPRPNYRHNGNFGIENTFREPNTHANRTDYDGISAPFQPRPNYRHNGNFGIENTFREPNTHANRTDYDGIGAPFQPRPNYRHNGNFGIENTFREPNTNANRTDYDGIGAHFQLRPNDRYNGKFGTENTLRLSRRGSRKHQRHLPPRIFTDNSPSPKTGCRFSYKMLVPITLFILIGAVTLLIVLLNVPKEYTNTIAGCSESYVSLGSESYTSCHFGYDVISEIDIIQLKTKHGDIIFPNPFKNRTFGNDTETNSTGVITLNDWTLKYRSDDGGTVEFFFLTNITSCDMKGTYEVVTKNRNNETRNYPFEVKIADDYSTQYSIIAYDEGLTSPTLEMRCDGSVSCKDYLFYQASVTKDGKALNENMFCNLNRTKSGKVRTTCTTKMTDPELMKKANTTLYCSPSVPTNINTTVNSSSQEYRPNVLKDLCAARLDAGFGEPLHYYCNKRIHNADENAFPLKIEVLKGQEKIASLTVPKDGTSQKSSMGRYQLKGHLQGNILAININLTIVYHCDDGFYTVKVTNASDIKFELILPDFGSSSNCPKELKIPWQQHMKHNCQFCSERDVALLYDTNGEQTKEIPSSGVQVAKTFQNGLVKLDFHIQNMTCDTSFAVLVVADINRTISLTSEASFFGKVEKTFSTQSATENHTMSFTHFLGCYGANILTLVSGPAVIHYTHNKTESKHDGIILQVTVTYQTEYAFNGSLISSVVTYNDLEMKVKRSDDHFVVIHLPEDFCYERQGRCNYRHPSFKDRFVACSSNVSLPIELHCPDGLKWHDPQKNCLGICEENSEMY